MKPESRHAGGSMKSGKRMTTQASSAGSVQAYAALAWWCTRSVSTLSRIDLPIRAHAAPTPVCTMGSSWRTGSAQC